MSLTATQIATLKTELTTDPRGYGYSAAQRNDQSMADKLNLIRDGSAGTVPSNPTAAGGQASGIISEYRKDIAVREIIAAIAPADFAALTQLQCAKLSLQFAGTGMVIDATNANTRGSFAGIFSGMSAATTNAINALASRSGSRAEELFGVGVSVSIDDVGRALNS